MKKISQEYLVVARARLEEASGREVKSRTSFILNLAEIAFDEVRLASAVARDFVLGHTVDAELVTPEPESHFAEAA